MPLALFGITNDGLNLAVNLIVLFLVVVYIALIVWTYMDARRRLEDPVLVGSATVAAFFPFVGPLVYSILRPPEFLGDKLERELEIRSAELRVRQLEEASCPRCSFPIERTYLRCPSCKARVKDPCESCGKPIDPRWSLCPYCETPVRREAPPAKPPAKRRAKAPATGAERRRRPEEAARKAPPPQRKAAASTKAPAERGERPRKPRPGSKSPRPSSAKSDSPRKAAPEADESQSRPATT